MHPKQNRIDYGDQLIPEDGYELAYAVGTTYSLDLEALMILPVALFYSQKLDCNPTEMRYDMLDAITKASEKICIFYQNGLLKVPQKYHHLMAYWEKGIHAVTMPNHVSSFHPKIWIIRYESESLPPKYRVLVMSRNLTFVRDWDIAFSTDGIVTEEEQSKNIPLIDFLNHLNSSGANNLPSNFIKDLMKVKFDIPDKFQSLKFFPIGIPSSDARKNYFNPITAPKVKWDEMLIVSPFVDNTTLKTIGEKTAKKPFLLSRKDEMDCVDISVLKGFDSWNFSTFIQEAEFLQELEDGESVPLPQNLHAKFFVGMNNDIPYWYIGSANCTDPAQMRNVEFMIELKGEKISGLKTKDVFKTLTDPNKSDGITLFSKYQYDSRNSSEEQKSIELEIRKIKYDLSCLPIKGSTTLIENGTAYNLLIEVDASNLQIPKGYEVAYKPLPESQKNADKLIAGQPNINEKYTGYSETSLSIFLIFEILKEGEVQSQFLLPMEIELPNTRLNRIFTSIINSRDKFLKYLSFLLSGEETEMIEITGEGSKGKIGEASNSLPFSGVPVFEKLLIAASRYPDKLKSVDLLVERLKSESEDLPEQIITPEFESFGTFLGLIYKTSNDAGKNQRYLIRS